MDEDETQALYTVTERSYINGRVFEAGETVAVAPDVVPGLHMVPLNDVARKAMDKAAAKLRPAPGDPRYIGDLIEHTMKDGSTLGRVESAPSKRAA